MQPRRRDAGPSWTWVAVLTALAIVSFISGIFIDDSVVTTVCGVVILIGAAVLVFLKNSAGRARP